VIQQIRALGSGDIMIKRETPHDYNLLRTGWTAHAEYGPLIPKIPKENTVDQSVVIRGVHLLISESEIKEELFLQKIAPKQITRIISKSSGPTTNIQLILDSKSEQEKLLKENIRLFHQCSPSNNIL
jgi:hypothetical protein